MKTVGVVIDEWKLPIFEKHLKLSGYPYEKIIGPIKGTFTLRVSFDWVHKLKPIIDAANLECRGTSAHLP